MNMQTEPWKTGQAVAPDGNTKTDYVMRLGWSQKERLQVWIDKRLVTHFWQNSTIDFALVGNRLHAHLSPANPVPGRLVRPGSKVHERDGREVVCLGFPPGAGEPLKRLGVTDFCLTSAESVYQNGNAFVLVMPIALQPAASRTYRPGGRGRSAQGKVAPPAPIAPMAPVTEAKSLIVRLNELTENGSGLVLYFREDGKLGGRYEL